jgi:hypothetical protein
LPALLGFADGFLEGGVFFFAGFAGRGAAFFGGTGGGPAFFGAEAGLPA